MAEMLDIHNDSDSSPSNIKANNHSEKQSALQDDDATDLIFGIGSGSESESEECILAKEESSSIAVSTSDDRIPSSVAIEKKSEAISSNDNFSQNSTDEKVLKIAGKHCAPEKSTVKELEEGEIESDSDDEDLVKAKILYEKPHLSFESRFSTKQQSEAPLFSAVAVQSSPSHSVGVCRYFLRGACTWGDNCKYYHSTSRTDVGRYNDNPRSSYSYANKSQKSSHRRSVSSRSSPEDNVQKRVSSVKDARPILDNQNFHRSSRNEKTKRTHSSSSESFISSSESSATSLNSISRRRHVHNRHSRRLPHETDRGRYSPLHNTCPSAYAQNNDGERSHRRSSRSRSMSRCEKSTSTASSTNSRPSRRRRRRGSSAKHREDDGDGVSSSVGRRSAPSVSKRDDQKKRKSQSSSVADLKTRRMSPNIEPISSDSDETADTNELKLRNTLGAELRRTTSKDFSDGQKTPRLHA